MISKRLGRVLDCLRKGLRGRPIPEPYDRYLNPPVRFRDGDWFANERLVELPFIFSQIDMNGSGRHALEFGCTRSTLALQLASLGYDVVGVDLRPYDLAHPNLSFFQGNLLELDTAAEGSFDLVTAVSVIEHVGLGAYGEESSETERARVIAKLVDLLRPGGKLIVTLPVGRPDVDDFERSFHPDEALDLFDHSRLERTAARYFRRERWKSWQSCTVEEVASVSNSRDDRGPTGVNGVGCFVWRKN
ncbi:MAG: class I SAM-dependent methyltransferase [Candidatus Promineifilaceae bacterium]|nr:class I SAM-dependent methyltransferase [Candidatus Promineifilaceae bacterium]